MTSLNDIYKSSYLKHPLTEDEYLNINNAWEFLKHFERKEVSLMDYRQRIINKISFLYDVGKFYYYEKILSKMLWNLRWLLYPIWTDPNISQDKYWNIVHNSYNNVNRLPYGLLLCKPIKFKDENTINRELEKLAMSRKGYYRSFINKMVIIDKSRNIIYSKPAEGSSSVLMKNYFNLYSFTIFHTRNIYEEFMKDPYNNVNIDIILPQFYHEQTYPFPNLNFCSYKLGTQNDRKERIRKMYYNGTDEYWFSLIK